MKHLIRYLTLPKTVTPFEERYLRRINKIALAIFALHPPVFALVAYLAGTSVPTAIALSSAAVAGPVLGYIAFANRPRLVGMVYGVGAMLMGGVLVYIGQGPMQIEMHFYFFVMIALLAVFGNPSVILCATATVAAHHFAMWLLLPRGVFNYEASLATVIVHAIFVIIESAAAVFVARSFFDNVIGLEKIVTTRTAALDDRNRDMARILDHVSQGFISAGLDGTLGGEWSNALERWFGAPAPAAKLWDYLLADPDQRAWMQVGLEGLVDGFMPFEVVIDQLPCRFAKAGREFHVEYQAIGEAGEPSGLLVVVSDVTDEIARETAEAVQRELMVVVEKAYRDRGEFTAFIAETEDLVQACADLDDDLVDLKRRLHTLKGNTALFGVTSVSTLCHELEGTIDDTGETLPPAARARLADAWKQVRERIERVLGLTGKRALVVDWDDYQSVIAAMPMPEPQWAHRMRDWGKVSTRGRLEQFGDYARGLAARLGKAEPAIVVVDNDVRLPSDQFTSVWPVFVHAVRNMVDHGIAGADARAAAGKPPNACLTLVTELANGDLRLAIADDGDGIAWDRVAEQARARGLRADTREDLEEALFTTGVSTAADVTDVSGRGVGMGALRSAVRRLGGAVEVASRPGAGTRITCVLPMALVASPPRGLATQPLPVMQVVM